MTVNKMTAVTAAHAWMLDAWGTVWVGHGKVKTRDGARSSGEHAPPVDPWLLHLDIQPRRRVWFFFLLNWLPSSGFTTISSTLRFRLRPRSGSSAWWSS